MIERLDEKFKSDELLDGLNEPQKQAVSIIEGPLLVLAGAGTGKTKVLTSRIANILLSKLAFPGQILAVTFTNKAAKEMKHRVESLIGSSVDGLWLGTFHSIAAKILRRHAKEVGLNPDFTILDSEDQFRLVKQIFTDYNIDSDKTSTKSFLYHIGHFKDKALTPENLNSAHNSYFSNYSLAQLYQEYQRRLKSLNAVDFGDLLLYNIELFNKHLSILLEYQARFKYILVDEYQDTNISQYLWLRILAQGSGNICCVGDDDQSIYGWRGAEVTNILKFDRDFPNAKIIRLQQNYRSTNHILGAATKLISNNKERHGKTLWTEQTSGDAIKLSSFYDDKEEANYVADEIDSLNRLNDINYGDIAILVRAGFQTRSFEESLNFLRIPYKIVGGLKFYERLEIKDAIAYIRTISNQNDSLAFERIINTPKRGVGNTTLQKMQMISRDNDISLFEAAKLLLRSTDSKAKAMQSLTLLVDNINRWKQLLLTMPHYEVVDLMLQESGYIDMWKLEASGNSKERLENIKELLRVLADYTSLPEFLEHVSLVSDSDSLDNDNVVNVMTMHAAKGLEFKVVFLPGWEEGVFPSARSIEENGIMGLEEERRLAYVGITRAREQLFISFACNRRVWGNYQYNQPSRFIDELAREHVEILNNNGIFRNKSTDFKKNKPAVTSPALNDEQEKFRNGSRVFHGKFGYGAIVSIQGDSAQVAFEKTDTKKVLLDYLQRV